VLLAGALPRKIAPNALADGPVGELLALIEAYGTRCYAVVGRKSFLASLMLKAQLGCNSEAA
jgi:hypothetical protein